MVNAAIIRCEKNMDRCPMTNCFRSLVQSKDGFALYDECMPAGVFTCRCPGENVIDLARILKAKGAQAIHFCTCTFARKADSGWRMDSGGFCERIDELVARVKQDTGLPCVKGTAHLPEGYRPAAWR